MNEGINEIDFLMDLHLAFLVAPESIHRHVKTYKQEAKNMHFIAPEYGKKPVSIFPRVSIVFACLVACFA